MDTREAALQSFHEKSLRGVQAEETGGLRAPELVEQTELSHGLASLTCKRAFFAQGQGLCFLNA